MYKRILVPIDDGPASQSGLNEALLLAKQNKAKVKLLHVVGFFLPTSSLQRGRGVDDVHEALHESGQRILNDAEKLARRHRIAAETVMLTTAKARAADVILQHAKKWRADLIVIGTHGRRGLARLALGSEAERVIRGSPSAVLVVRPRRTRR